MNKLCAPSPHKKETPIRRKMPRDCTSAYRLQTHRTDVFFLALLNSSLSARFLNPAENRQKIFASVPLDLLSFLGTRPQTSNDDITDLPK